MSHALFGLAPSKCIHIVKLPFCREKGDRILLIVMSRDYRVSRENGVGYIPFFYIHQQKATYLLMDIDIKFQSICFFTSLSAKWKCFCTCEIMFTECVFEKNPKFLLLSEAFILPFSRSKTQFPVEINVMSSSK